jgi:predicted amidophosphoribosyltransferase
MSKTIDEELRKIEPCTYCGKEYPRIELDPDGYCDICLEALSLTEEQSEEALAE